MKPYLAKYSECTGCGACVASCNVGAIALDYDRNGHLMPVINSDKCVGCGRCSKNCPVINGKRIKFNTPEDICTYTAWSKNEDVCLKATSGGVFSQMATDFLDLPGASVYGAFLTNHNTCHHIEINEKKDLHLIIGTKYLQSDASRVFSSIKKHLRRDEPCLFCGTPCQVAGLYSFLNNISTEHLYTIELICHGVPSKITTEIACKAHNATHIVSYRNKSGGHKKGFSCTYENAEGERKTIQDCVFSQIFGKTDRPSCYQCQYARIERTADLTIGDQWGLLNKYPQRKSLGSNLVMCNSEKGKKLLLWSDNIEKDQNPNVTLNAPTLFMPVKIGATSYTKSLYRLRNLPLNTQINILSNNWRKAPYLLPIAILKRINRYIYEKQFSAKLAEVRNRLGWKK